MIIDHRLFSALVASDKGHEVFDLYAGRPPSVHKNSGQVVVGKRQAGVQNKTEQMEYVVPQDADNPGCYQERLLIDSSPRQVCSWALRNNESKASSPWMSGVIWLSCGNNPDVQMRIAVV